MELIKNIIKKPTRICENTVTCYQLTDNDIELLQLYIPFEKDEILYMLYSYRNKFEPLVIDGEIIVGMSSKKIFKLENKEYSYVYIKDIFMVRNNYIGLFIWNKLEITLQNNTIQTFGIYGNETCEYFTSYLQNLIRNENIRKMNCIPLNILNSKLNL